MALVPTLIDDARDLERHREEWDALAVAARRPFCSPAWMLAWERHVPDARCRLRTVLVHDGDQLAAVAPFYSERRRGGPIRYRILAAATSHRAEPVARAGSEREVARVIARTLAEASPRPAVIAFESVDERIDWPTLLSAWWPGRGSPAAIAGWSAPAPTISLAGSFESWLQGKSSNFRSQSRRLRRRLEARGARFRVAATAEELERGLVDFARLHYARWEDRGGTHALSPAVERMLADAGRELLPSARMRLVSIELGGETISSHLFVAAGGEVSYWNGGFDERFAAEKPSMQALLAAIEDAFSRCDRCFDLGGGGQPYKYRLADGEERVRSQSLAVKDGRYPITRLQLAPRQLRRELAGHLPDGVRRALRRVTRKAP